MLLSGRESVIIRNISRTRPVRFVSVAVIQIDVLDVLIDESLLELELRWTQLVLSQNRVF